MPLKQVKITGLAILFPALALFFIFFADAGATEKAEKAAQPITLRSPYEKTAERAVKSHSGANTESEGSVAPIGATRILGGITPHHDLAFPMIVRFYDRLAAANSARRGAVKRVWLFSPDHFRKVRNLAAICDADWALFARTLKADREACAMLEAIRGVEARPEIFSNEHGITLHIPMIARYFPDAAVVPILLNPKAADMGLLILRGKIAALFGEGDLIILSMDLSHYKTPEAMAAEDERTLPVLEKLAFRAAGDLDVDARRAVALVLMLFKTQGAPGGRVLERADSSYFLARRVESGTSYATIIYEGAAVK